MITTILIDIDDTLLDFNLCARWAMEKTAQKMHLTFGPDAFSCFQKINASLWKQMEQKLIQTADIYNTRWNMVSEALNIPFDGTVFENYFLDYLSKSTIEVNGALELLAYLSQKYKVYAASNGPYDQQVERMQLANMDKYLSGYFVSEKVGHSKPSKEFFDTCFKQTQVNDVSELFMIGDSLSADITGASNYGIKTCWFNKNHKDVPTTSDYVVYDLLEIKKIL